VNSRMTTGADDNPPGANAVGAQENCGSSWPTHRHGSASIRAANSARRLADSSAPTIVSPPVTDRINNDDSRASRCERSVSIPPQYIGGDASSGLSPSIRSHSSGRNRCSPGLSSTPLPSVLTTVTAPRRSTSTSPATPSRESWRRSRGSA